MCQAQLNFLKRLSTSSPSSCKRKHFILRDRMVEFSEFRRQCYGISLFTLGGGEGCLSPQPCEVPHGDCLLSEIGEAGRDTQVGRLLFTICQGRVISVGGSKSSLPRASDLSHLDETLLPRAVCWREGAPTERLWRCFQEWEPRVPWKLLSAGMA